MLYLHGGGYVVGSLVSHGSLATHLAAAASARVVLFDYRLAPKDPLASPLFGDLEGLPPLLVHVGSREVLLDDARTLVERAADAGVDATLHMGEGLIRLAPVRGHDPRGDGIGARGGGLDRGARRRDVSEAQLGFERSGAVAVVELRRPPHNFVDPVALAELADAVEEVDQDPACGAVVLAAEGKSFCAGANFAGGGGGDGGGGDFRTGARRFYDQALRLFAASTPVVAAVHGAAVGGGLGLALVADVRVTCPEARFTANFVKLGIHPGFGLSVTLPALLGPSRAADLFLTGRRVDGEEALRMGLADRCVAQDAVRDAAVELATEMAAAAPLAVAAVRATLRQGLVERVRAALAHELEEQVRLVETEDAREGMAAVFSRREPTFHGR